MINVYSTLDALKDLLKKSSSFNKYAIRVGGIVNSDPNTASKWMGLYRDSLDINPNTLGNSTGARHNISQFRVIAILQSYGSDGDKVESLLDSKVRDYLDFLRDNHKISGTVDMVLSHEVNYSYMMEEDESFIFQNAVIYTTVEKRV